MDYLTNSFYSSFWVLFVDFDYLGYLLNLFSIPYRWNYVLICLSIGVSWMGLVCHRIILCIGFIDRTDTRTLLLLFCLIRIPLLLSSIALFHYFSIGFLNVQHILQELCPGLLNHLDFIVSRSDRSNSSGHCSKNHELKCLWMFSFGNLQRIQNLKTVLHTNFYLLFLQLA